MKDGIYLFRNNFTEIMENNNALPTSMFTIKTAFTRSFNFVRYIERIKLVRILLLVTIFAGILIIVFLSLYNANKLKEQNKVTAIKVNTIAMLLKEKQCSEDASMFTTLQSLIQRSSSFVADTNKVTPLKTELSLAAVKNNLISDNKGLLADLAGLNTQIAQKVALDGCRV